MITIKEWRKLTKHSPMSEENRKRVEACINYSNGQNTKCELIVSVRELDWLADNGFNPLIDNGKVEIEL